MKSLLSDERIIFPVIWVRQEFEPDLSDAHLGVKKGLKLPETIKGTGGEKLLPGLHATRNDYEVVKKRYSAFFKTNLYIEPISNLLS